MGFGLCFQDFGQELKFLPHKNAALQLCILLLRGTNESMRDVQLFIKEDISYVNLNDFYL